MEDAINEFGGNCGAITKDDASFLLQETNTLLNSCWTGHQSCDGDLSKQSAQTSRLHMLSEIVLVIVKMLCKSSHSDLACDFLADIESNFMDHGARQCTALLLGKWAVKMYPSVVTDEKSVQALKECARALRSLPVDLLNQEAHAVLEGCGLVMWAVESGNSKALSGSVLLAWFSFLEEYQECILKVLKKVRAVTYLLRSPLTSLDM